MEDKEDVKWYEETKGQSSSMRIAMMICVLTGCYIAIAGLHIGANMMEVMGTAIGIIGAGFTGKVIQKSKE